MGFPFRRAFTRGPGHHRAGAVRAAAPGRGLLRGRGGRGGGPGAGGSRVFPSALSLDHGELFPYGKDQIFLEEVVVPPMVFPPIMVTWFTMVDHEKVVFHLWVTFSMWSPTFMGPFDQPCQKSRRFCPKLAGARDAGNEKCNDPTGSFLSGIPKLFPTSPTYRPGKTCWRGKKYGTRTGMNLKNSERKNHQYGVTSLKGNHQIVGWCFLVYWLVFFEGTPSVCGFGRNGSIHEFGGPLEQCNAVGTPFGFCL